MTMMQLVSRDFNGWTIGAGIFHTGILLFSNTIIPDLKLSNIWRQSASVVFVYQLLGPPLNPREIGGGQERG